jgi:hypothetical protein
MSSPDLALDCSLKTRNMKYIVYCTKIYNGSVEVDADCKEDALDIAEQSINDGKVEWEFGEATADYAEEDLDGLLGKLNDKKGVYDLEGVELTYEDAQNVVDFITDGMTEDQAVEKVLQGIREVISQGW